jgi:hypothetical protein
MSKILKKIMEDRENFKQSEKSNTQETFAEWIYDALALLCICVLFGCIYLGCYAIK